VNAQVSALQRRVGHLRRPPGSTTDQQTVSRRAGCTATPLSHTAPSTAAASWAVRAAPAPCSFRGPG